MSESFSEDPRAVVQSERGSQSHRDSERGSQSRRDSERSQSRRDSERSQSRRESRPASNPRRLYVRLRGGDGFSTEQLTEIFCGYGAIEDTSIPYRRSNAFVTMETQEAASRAIANVRKDHPEIAECSVAYPRDENRYYRGRTHYNRHKKRTNSWRGRDNDRHSDDRERRNRKPWKRKSRSGADFKSFNKDKRESNDEFESSTLSSQAPSFASANSYRADSVNQLGPQFAQMNLNQNVPLTYENTQNILAMSQMDPLQQAAYNQYLMGLYGGMPMMMNPIALDAYGQPQTQMVDPQQVQNAYDAQNMFRFYQPPNHQPLLMQFPQYSENPFGLVQLQDQSAEAMLQAEADLDEEKPIGA